MIASRILDDNIGHSYAHRVIHYPEGTWTGSRLKADPVTGHDAPRDMMTVWYGPDDFMDLPKNWEAS